MGSSEMSGDTLALALGGDADAQAAMFDRVLALGMERAFPDEVVLHWAEWWGRLAASHGRSSDVLRLVGVIMLKAGIAYGEGLDGIGAAIAAEALARLDRLADEGDEEAARQLVRVADVMAAHGDARDAFALAATYDLDGL